MSFQGETSTEKQFKDPYFGAGTVKICGFDILSHFFRLSLESSKAV